MERKGPEEWGKTMVLQIDPTLQTLMSISSAPVGTSNWVSSKQIVPGWSSSKMVILVVVSSPTILGGSVDSFIGRWICAAIKQIGWPEDENKAREDCRNCSVRTS